MKNILFLLVLSFISYTITAQTGPGGVGNSTSNPYWIDIHTNGGANGAAVSSVTDYSGNGANAVQSVLTEQPIFTTNAVNGRSALTFNGGQCLISPAVSSINSPNYINYYVVAQINDYATLSMPFNIDYGTPYYLDAFSGLLVQSGSIKSYGRNLSNGLKRAEIGNPAGFNVFESRYDLTATELTSRLNFLTTNTEINVNKPSPSTNQGFWLGGKSGLYNISGLISEVFVFNFQLNTAQEKIVQNYISAKFGTTITNDMYAYETTYGLGVVGIGQDDASNNHLTSQGNGVVRISKNTLNNGDYLFIGHDDVPLSSMAFDVPVSMVNGARFQRVWRADETVDIGTITLVFDLDPSTDFSADPNNYRLLIDHSDNDFSVVDLSMAGTYNAITNEITFTNVDLQAGSYFTLAGDAPQDIISITTGLWNQPTTWNCSCVPGAFDKVTVDDTHTVTLNVDAAVTKLTINPTGNLTWSSNQNLELTDSLKVYGAFNMGTTGQVSFIGNGSQVIDLNGGLVDFTNVNISNTGTGVVLANGSLQLNGLLSFGGGDFDYTAGTLIVNSTSSTTTGRVGPIPSGVTLSGTATVRRFLPAGSAGERTLSSPVIGANLSMWDATIAISGVGFPDGCAWGNGQCYYSCKKFLGGEFATDYIDVTNPNEPLESGVGYELFIGDDLNTWSGATVSSTGSLRPSTDFNYSTGAYQWNIIGNPYASPILFDDMVVGNSNVFNYFYVFDANTGSYQWYQVGGGSSVPELANGHIAIGQGIWVFGGFAGPVITYRQSFKVDGANFIKKQVPNTYIKLQLTQEGTTYKNVAMIDFNPNSFDDYDSLDVRAFTFAKQKASYLMINTPQEKLVKNYLSTDGRDKVVDLTVKILSEGYFSIDVSNIENHSTYEYITLIDNLTHQKINLRKYPHYTFYSEEGEFDRFTLVLSNERIIGNSLSVITTEVSDIKITQIGNAVNVVSDELIEGNSELVIYNLLGQELIFSTTFEVQKGDNMIFVPESIKGIFIVVVKTPNGVETKKMLF